LARLDKYFHVGKKGGKWKHFDILKIEQYIHFETNLIFKGLNIFRRYLNFVPSFLCSCSICNWTERHSSDVCTIKTMSEPEMLNQH